MSGLKEACVSGKRDLHIRQKRPTNEQKRPTNEQKRPTNEQKRHIHTLAHAYSEAEALALLVAQVLKDVGVV